MTVLLLRRLCASRVRLPVRLVLQHRVQGYGPGATVPNARSRHGRAERWTRCDVAEAARRGYGRRLEPAAAGHVLVHQARREPRPAAAQGAAAPVGPRRHDLLCNPPRGRTHIALRSPLHLKGTKACERPRCSGTCANSKRAAQALRSSTKRRRLRRSRPSRRRRSSLRCSRTWPSPRLRRCACKPLARLIHASRAGGARKLL
jgi:hypothetical protein